MADPQKYKVYDSERCLDNDPRVFRSKDEAQAFADRVVNSDLWKRNSDVTKVLVFLGRTDSSKACAYGAGSSWRGTTYAEPFVTLPPSWATDWPTMLHELAHIMAGSGHGHDRVYATCYLKLVREFMGPISYRKLRDAFTDNEVDYKGAVKSAAKESPKSPGTTPVEHYMAQINAIMKRA